MTKASMTDINGKFTLARKPAIWLLCASTIGLLLRAYTPLDWPAIRILGGLVHLFCVGILVAPHLAIWELRAAPDAPAEPLGATVQSDWPA